MQKPRLYVCFGVPRSGSTLAFQLSRAVAARGGFDQSAVHPKHKANAYSNQTEDGFSELLAHAERLDRYMVVVKTHSPPTPSLMRAVLEGHALVQVHTRDPRDIALSMMDAARRGEAWGKSHQGEPLQNTSDALVRLKRLMRRHEDWAEMPRALCLDYESTAFSTRQTARRIADHMSVRAAPLRDAIRAKRRFIQFNTGRSQRHLSEMSGEEQLTWYREFREHIDAYCPPPVGPTWPSRITARVAQWSRWRG